MNPPINHRYPGRFVTFEGPEGAGKSTQLKILARQLESQEVPFLLTRDPGGTALGKQIRRILLNANCPLDPLSELLLYESDRAQHVREVIIPALVQGKLVLCDRYTDSTRAYQGHGRGQSMELIEQLNQIAAGGLAPELTVLFDLPSEQGLSRLHPGSHDRLEREALEFHHRVRAGYLQMAASEPDRWVVLDASVPLSTVQDALQKILQEKGLIPMGLA